VTAATGVPQDRLLQWFEMIGRHRFLGMVVFLSSAATFLAYRALFDVFHRFDWNQPVVKLAAFQALFLLILLLSLWHKRSHGRATDEVLVAELGAAALIICWEIARTISLLRSGLHTAMNDLGQTTEDAVRTLLLDRGNPYLREIARNGDDPAFWGFKYGPGMLLGYWPAGLLPGGIGLKACNLGYLAASVAMLAWLAVRAEPSTGRPGWLRYTPGLVVSTLVLLPERLHHELFNQGAVDMFPVMLLIAAMLCVRQGWWFAAGLVAGLSFAAKFSPAAFLLVLFIRRHIAPRFALGLALGLLPFLPFLLWDAPSLVRNVFLFHSGKAFDNTSLYSVTPPELHYLFTTFQVAAVALAVAFNFKRPLELRSLVASFTLLLIAIEVSYREMHGNHLVWLVPVVALSLTWYRHWITRWLPA
jgi:hypothetical protein